MSPLIAPTLTEVEPQSVLTTLRYSAITFHLDMTKRDSTVIPIGIIAEIYLPTVYALGLIARTELVACRSESVTAVATSKIKSWLMHGACQLFGPYLLPESRANELSATGH